MSIIILMMVNLFFIYLCPYIGFDVSIVRQIGIFLMGAYVVIQFGVIVFYCIRKRQFIS
jgi:hypothetical protein